MGWDTGKQDSRDWVQLMHRTKVIYICLSMLLIPVAKAGDISGKVTGNGASGKDDAVVYIKKIDSKFTPPESPAIMDQVNLEFRPHVLPIVVGTQVDFHNSDDVLHNVFTPNVCGGQIDLGTWPKGEKRGHVVQVEG